MSLRSRTTHIADHMRLKWISIAAPKIEMEGWEKSDSNYSFISTKLASLAVLLVGEQSLL
jgi:hypothetical protein